MGDKPEQLAELLGDNKKVAVISNALDFSTDLARREQSQKREFDDLKSIGLDAEELDLRLYFGKQGELKKKMKEYGLMWVRGGNAFVLRRAMRQSGLDEILKELSKGDDIVYGGYSAGVCVIGPTLKGVELVDDPTIIPDGYQKEILWEGIGLIDFSFAPHYQSDHTESSAVDKMIDFYKKNTMPFRALKDGEVIIRTV